MRSNLAQRALKIARDTKSEFSIGSDVEVALELSDHSDLATYRFYAPWSEVAFVITSFDFEKNGSVNRIRDLVRSRTRNALIELTRQKLAKEET